MKQLIGPFVGQGDVLDIVAQRLDDEVVMARNICIKCGYLCTSNVDEVGHLEVVMNGKGANKPRSIVRFWSCWSLTNFVEAVYLQTGAA